MVSTVGTKARVCLAVLVCASHLASSLSPFHLTVHPLISRCPFLATLAQVDASVDAVQQSLDKAKSDLVSRVDAAALSAAQSGQVRALCKTTDFIFLLSSLSPVPLATNDFPPWIPLQRAAEGIKTLRASLDAVLQEQETLRASSSTSLAKHRARPEAKPPLLCPWAPRAPGDATTYEETQSIDSSHLQVSLRLRWPSNKLRRRSCGRLWRRFQRLCHRRAPPSVSLHYGHSTLSLVSPGLPDTLGSAGAVAHPLLTLSGRFRFCRRSATERTRRSALRRHSGRTLRRGCRRASKASLHSSGRTVPQRRVRTGHLHLLPDSSLAITESQVICLMPKIIQNFDLFPTTWPVSDRLCEGS